jgi:hypothetical protein
MRNNEIPYHPLADRSKDSLLRTDSCVTRLELLCDVITEWLASCGKMPAGSRPPAVTGCDMQAPTCLAKIKQRIKRALRHIKQGERASDVYARTITDISEDLRTHKQEFKESGDDTYNAYGRQLSKALSEAVQLRDRIAHQ